MQRKARELFWKKAGRAESETSWQHPWTAEERKELWGEQGSKQPRVRGVELSHLTGSTHWSNPETDVKCEWVLLARVVQNGHESSTRHMFIKAKGTLEIRSSLCNLLTSPRWSLLPQGGLQTYTTSILTWILQAAHLQVCSSKLIAVTSHKIVIINYQ